MSQNTALTHLGSDLQRHYQAWLSACHTGGWEACDQLSERLLQLAGEMQARPAADKSSVEQQLSTFLNSGWETEGFSTEKEFSPAGQDADPFQTRQTGPAGLVPHQPVTGKRFDAGPPPAPTGYQPMSSTARPLQPTLPGHNALPDFSQVVHPTAQQIKADVASASDLDFPIAEQTRPPDSKAFPDPARAPIPLDLPLAQPVFSTLRGLNDFAAGLTESPHSPQFWAENPADTFHQPAETKPLKSTPTAAGWDNPLPKSTWSQSGGVQISQQNEVSAQMPDNEIVEWQYASSIPTAVTGTPLLSQANFASSDVDSLPDNQVFMPFQPLPQPPDMEEVMDEFSQRIQQAFRRFYG